MLTVFGSLNLDYVAFAPRVPGPGETVPGTRFAMHAGGKGANQAFAAARLGAPVRLIGRVGRDSQGDWLVAQLRAGGVDVSGVSRHDTETTGVALIVVDQAGENSITVVAGANGTLTPEDVAASGGFAGARVVLLQLETPIPTVLAAARQARDVGAVVVLDPAPARPLPDELVGLVDYLTPNESELGALCGVAPGPLSRSDAARLARRLVDRGAPRVVVKLGAAGALLVEATSEHWWPAFEVEAVDTTAAGDAFNAALGVAVAEGVPLVEAGRFATAAAGCSVTCKGAQASMPDRGAVQTLLARGKLR